MYAPNILNILRGGDQNHQVLFGIIGMQQQAKPAQQCKSEQSASKEVETEED